MFDVGCVVCDTLASSFEYIKRDELIDILVEKLEHERETSYAIVEALPTQLHVTTAAESEDGRASVPAVIVRPKKVIAATTGEGNPEQHAESIKKLSQFLAECCEVSAGKRTGTGEFLAAYNDWADREGVPVSDAKTMAKAMLLKGFDKKPSAPAPGYARVNCYVGVYVQRVARVDV